MTALTSDEQFKLARELTDKLAPVETRRFLRERNIVDPSDWLYQASYSRFYPKIREEILFYALAYIEKECEEKPEWCACHHSDSSELLQTIENLVNVHTFQFSQEN